MHDFTIHTWSNFLLDTGSRFRPCIVSPTSKEEHHCDEYHLFFNRSVCILHLRPPDIGCNDQWWSGDQTRSGRHRGTAATTSRTIIEEKLRLQIDDLHHPKPGCRYCSALCHVVFPVRLLATSHNTTSWRRVNEVARLIAVWLLYAFDVDFRWSPI